MGVPAPASPSDFLSLSSQLGQQAGYTPMTAMEAQMNMQQAQANYTQLQMRAQQINAIASLAGGGLGLGGWAASSADPLWLASRGLTKYRKRATLGTRTKHRRRLFMRMTKKGYETRQRLERAFWWFCAAASAFIAAPILMRFFTAIWAWGLGGG